MVLKPGILKVFMIGDLVNVQGVKIRTFVVIVHDGAGAPRGFVPGIFILQADKQKDIT